MTPPATNSADWRRFVVVGLIIALMVGLRLVALDSDPYAGLSWSGALVTDEGFYTHNARNVALFGRARTDEFNNMLIMPTLHFLQVATFRVFGVGAVSARMVSVALSLLTLGVFYGALRRLYGGRVAGVGTIFLGLDHVNLLYNRMALMDTPAAFVLVCAFGAWARMSVAETRLLRLGWAAASGALMGLTLTIRGLAAFVLPAGLTMRPNPPRPLPWARGGALGKGESNADASTGDSPFPASEAKRIREGEHPGSVGRGWGVRAAWLGGFAASVLLYGAIWWLPHRAELGRMSRFYLLEQLAPHGLGALGFNVANALFGDSQGMAAYLFRHSPVVFGLATMGLAAWVARCRALRDAGYLMVWLVLGLVFFAVIRFPPPRYFVLFYPALIGVAALTLGRWEEVGAALRDSRSSRAVLVGMGVYHGALSVLHHGSLGSEVVLYGLTGVAAIGAWRRPFGVGGGGSWRIALCLWAGVNGCWLGGWLGRISYAQRDADRALARSLPAGSVLIGDAAPGLCMRNRFVAVPVFPGLANDVRPVERFAPAPRYVVILDGKRNTGWWRARYPEIITEEHRIFRFDWLRFPVSVYDTGMQFSLRRHKDTKKAGN